MTIIKGHYEYVKLWADAEPEYFDTIYNDYATITNYPIILEVYIAEPKRL